MTSKVQTSRESPQILCDRGRLTLDDTAAYGGAVPRSPPAISPAPVRPSGRRALARRRLRRRGARVVDRRALARGRPRLYRGLAAQPVGQAARGRRPLRRGHPSRPGGRPGLARRRPRPRRPGCPGARRRARPQGHDLCPRRRPTSPRTPPRCSPRPATWTRPAEFTRTAPRPNPRTPRPGCGSPSSPSIAPSSKRPKRR
jgi:hypothetical protein